MAKSEGSFVGKLIIIVILLGLGIALGISPLGWQVKKIYYTIRYYNTPIAKDFLSKPFSLHVSYSRNDAGELETYLINEEKSEALPVYEIEGTTQVGDAEHRMRGIGEETRKKLIEAFEEAQEGGSAALEKLKQVLDNLGN